MKIQTIDIKQIELNNGQIEGLPKNPRFIKDNRYEKLKKSIQDYPEMLELRELIVFPFEDTFVTIAGNMRLRVIKELKHKDVPCKVLSGDTPIEKLKQITIKDNISFGHNDFELLANEWNMDELLDWGFEEEDFLGFDIEVGETESDDEVPDIEKDKVITVKGDLYELGRHRLLCGDSTIIDDVDKLLDGKNVDMVFTDPPYGVDYVSRVDKDKRKPWGNIKNDDLKDEELKNFLYDSLGIYLENRYVCCNWQSVMDFMLALGKPNAFIVWDKQSIGLGAGYRNQHEIILFYGKLDHNSESNVWSIKRDSTNDYTHPTQKPIAIPIRAIINSSKKNMLVYDAFLGSGSTLIACEKTNRICYGMELDEYYCDVIVKRWIKWMIDNKKEKDIVLKRNGEAIDYKALL